MLPPCLTILMKVILQIFFYLLSIFIIFILAIYRTDRLQPAKHHQRPPGGWREHEVQVGSGGQRRLRGGLRAEERLRKNHLQGGRKLGRNSAKRVSYL